MPGIIVGNASNPLSGGVQPSTQMFSDIVSLFGVSGTMTRYLSGLPDGFGELDNRTTFRYSAVPSGGSNNLTQVRLGGVSSNWSPVSSTARFMDKDLFVRPDNNGLYQINGDNKSAVYRVDLDANPLYGSLPSNPSGSVRLDGQISCNAPAASTGLFSDGWREFGRAQTGAIGGHFSSLPSLDVYLRNHSSEGLYGSKVWTYQGPSNRWRWLIGEETQFSSSCIVKWNPNPDVRITKISGAGLRNVAQVQVDCYQSNNTRRFRTNATITGNDWSLDFAGNAPAATDRYEVTFTSSGSGGFRGIVFGGAQIVSSTAILAVDSNLGLIDYSDKNSAGTGIDAGRFRDDLDLQYKIEATEQFAVYRALKNLQGQATTWNLSPELPAVRGFLRRFNISMGNPWSTLRLRVEGLG